MYQAGYRDNGIYTIFPIVTGLNDVTRVYCDMETDGGGWIVFQRRRNGSVDFYRTWAEYQSGFGDLKNEFWLGNGILRDLTGSGDNYTLQVGSYDTRSTAGDSLTRAHNEHSFSTKDQDNDVSEINCAESYTGAWRYKHCHTANLNGAYYQQADVAHGQGIQWKSLKGYNYSLKKCSMKLRQVI
ncbi:ryncolin-1-like [Asterias amurensis]|uniref:ryncolin-1-like n=1 Tax=Asterias amurensis TaxID=7602 RepID=UPI003AB2529D